MKKLFTVSLLALLISSHAQDCPNPISNNSFQQFFNGIAAQSTNERKLQRANEMLRQYCLTAQQIKNVAILFTDDRTRLEFCEAAWHKTFDRVNFFDVYDAFSSIANAFRLYDYTRTGMANLPVTSPTPVVTQPTPQPIPQPVEPMFPKITYPSDDNYNGRVGCVGPIINDAQFMAIARDVNRQLTDEQKIEAIKTKGNICLSLEQLMKLSSLMRAEDQQLNAMYEFFRQVHDQDNYMQARVLFTSQRVKDQWSSLIGNYFSQMTQPGEVKPVVPDCTGTDADLKNAIKSVNSKTWPNDKLDALRLTARTKCFRLAQIRQLCDLFISEQDKLEVTKIFYAKCPEQDIYDQLTDVFVAYYFQQELMKFLKNGGK